MNYRRAAIVVLLSCCTFIAVTSPAVAADDAIVEFGKLPARFNGRVTTIEDAAGALLLQTSGRDHYFDDAGNRRPAAEWFLSEATSGADTPGPKIFEIRDATILELIGLAPRPEPGPLQHRYSFGEIRPAFPALTDTDGKAYPAAVSQALDRLKTALIANNVLRHAFQEPPGKDIEQLKAYMERVQLLDDAILPLLVPPMSAAFRWSPWGRAVLENILIEVTKPAEVTANPYFAPLQAIFAARRADDADALAKAVAAYAELLKQRPIAAAPLSFELPPGWQDQGVRIVNEGYYYEDTLADGAPIAVFRTANDDDALFLQLIYFPSQTATAERIINHWRIQAGLAPPADDELRKTLTPVRAGDVDGVLVDITATDRVPVYPQRVRAAVFRRDGDTLVVMASGRPEAVEPEVARFDALLKSLKLGPTEAVRAWCDVRVDSAATPDFRGFSTYLVTLPRGDDVWCFRFNGRQSLTEAARAACLRFIEQYPADGGVKKWIPPAGWKAEDETATSSFLYGEGEGSRYLTIVPLKGFSSMSELPLVNEFRTSFHLQPWTAAELTEQIKSIKIGDVDARAVEF